MGNFKLGMITGLDCMKFEAGTISPSIFGKKKKKRNNLKNPHWVYCCNIQNILSFL